MMRLIFAAFLCTLPSQIQAQTPNDTNGRPIQAADSANENAADNKEEDHDLGHGYSLHDGHIHFAGQRIDQTGKNELLKKFESAAGRPLKLAHDVDAPSFVALSEEYSKDKNKVYYKWISPGVFCVVTIPDADPKTFQVMDFNLARDKKHVWRTDMVIEGVDATTAEVVHPKFVWKDKNQVYYQFNPIPDADPATFRHLDQAFYSDSANVYWGGHKLENADLKTFRTFGNDIPYATDKARVWFTKNELPQVDAESFKLYHNHVFGDKDHVYVSGRPFEVIGADPTSFAKIAELENDKCVLFRDEQRHYVFDPAYTEVFALSIITDTISVSKPVWFNVGLQHIHGATISAILKPDGLLQVRLDVSPRFANAKAPTGEKEKLKRMESALLEARKRIVASDDQQVRNQSPRVVIPQAEHVSLWIRAVRAFDSQAFQSVWSKKAMEREGIEFKEFDPRRLMTHHRELWIGQFPNAKSDDFTFSFKGGKTKGEVTVSYKGESVDESLIGPLPVVNEDGQWKVDTIPHE